MSEKLRNKLLWVAVLILGVSCGSHSNDRPSCQLMEIRTLYYDVNLQPGVDTAYGHTVLIRDFSRECMDSATLVNIARKYIDTLRSGKPVNGVGLYNSDKDFNLHEHSQVMEEVNKSCLVHIEFDDKTEEPNSFVFYNDQGEIIYWGKRWVPFPKGNDIYHVK